MCLTTIGAAGPEPIEVLAPVEVLLTGVLVPPAVCAVVSSGHNSVCIKR